MGEQTSCSAFISKYEAVRSLAPRADCHCLKVLNWSLGGTALGRGTALANKEGEHQEMLISGMHRLCSTAACHCGIKASKERSSKGNKVSFVDVYW